MTEQVWDSCCFVWKRGGWRVDRLPCLVPLCFHLLFPALPWGAEQLNVALQTAEANRAAAEEEVARLEREAATGGGGGGGGVAGGAGRGKVGRDNRCCPPILAMVLGLLFVMALAAVVARRLLQPYLFHGI